MSEKMQETSADIIAEMLGARTEFPFVYLMGEPDTPEVIDCVTKEIIEPRKINIRCVTVKELADRLEAAHRREVDKLNSVIQATVSHSDAEIDRLRREITELKKKVGNAAKMYEALCEIAKRIENICGCDECDDREIGKIGALIKQTLAAPPRNCDVGTAMEQSERFSAYCRAHKHPESECLTCPIIGETCGYCELAWAQMPHEEGGAK